MKKAILILMMCISAFIFGEGTQEYSNDSDSTLQKQTQASLSEANKQIGMPAIKNFQERKLAKMIFELRDKADLITYAYIVSMNGNLIFVGKCIGFGLPYSVQFTNPVKVIDDPNGYGESGSILIPQADPNGLYMPQGLSATWLMMINPKTGNPEPVYFEPEIVVSPFPLH